MHFPYLYSNHLGRFGHYPATLALIQLSMPLFSSLALLQLFRAFPLLPGLWLLLVKSLLNTLSR